MRAITIRNLPPEVERVIKKRAEKEGSINRAVIKLLQEALGLAEHAGKPRRYHDLDHLKGTWSKREFDAFNQELTGQRKIHLDDWKD